MFIRKYPLCSCQLLRSVIRRKSNFQLRKLSLGSFSPVYLTKADDRTRNRRYASGSVSDVELEKFKQLSTEWWKPDGEYTAIRSLNKLRVPLIRDLLLRGCDDVHPSKPLMNFKILDVGCGGGILAEPLARLGASVTAIDPLPENIDAAKAHSFNNEELKTLTYECTTIEDLCRRDIERFDVVVASEVLEHVQTPRSFIRDCCSAVKPGGHIVVTTINRNLLSTILVKYAAEYLFRIVPENTHDENKFVTPDELTDMLRGSDMVGINFHGMMMNPLTHRWCWTDAYPMNYACYASKV